MLFAAAKRLDTIATVYTDHTCSIRILNCFYFLNMTLKPFFSTSQIGCRPLNNPIPAAKHRTDASVFFNSQLVSRVCDRRPRQLPNDSRPTCMKIALKLTEHA